MIPPIDVSVSNACSAEWDLLVAAVGYERRSRYIAENWSGASRIRAASAFDTHKMFSYETNLVRLSELGFEIAEHSETDVRYWLYKQLVEADSGRERSVRVALDVSSFSRSRLAQLVLGACEYAASRPVTIDFAYAPAAYRPPQSADTAIEVLGPVGPEFAGWSSDPEAPTTCVVGLGYEPERALGALEYLEPAAAWAFAPCGIDARYDRSVEKANAGVWDAVPPPSRIDYSVDQPMWTFVQLETLVFGLKRTTRPIIVPFGPKIFATVALLVGLLHHPDAAVWRVSGGPSEQPMERDPLGSIHTISALLEPSGVSLG